MSRVQAIERAFVVLGALADGPLGVTEVGVRAGLPKSTTARLLATLVAAGAVERVAGGTDYRVGGRMAALAAGVRPTRSLVAVARPHLVALAGAAGEAAGLSIPDGRLVHYVDQVDSPHPVGVRDWTGTRLPMHAVSSGLVFLAHMLPAEVDVLLARPLERFTPATVVDPAAIRERLRHVLLDGYAWTAEEVAEGITSVAAAVSDEDGEVVAAIHVHGPSYRFPGSSASAATVAAEVVAAAARISARIRQA
ncbi:MAG TPA: IclR family transcriptional regulator [Candidatus Sulfotelmatobacter sp.]|nr:IclR family transcriptional regulator [Candidatus Sulfotelmatobacter sp.]